MSNVVAQTAKECCEKQESASSASEIYRRETNDMILKMLANARKIKHDIDPQTALSQQDSAQFGIPAFCKVGSHWPTTGRVLKRRRRRKSDNWGRTKPGEGISQSRVTSVYGSLRTVARRAVMNVHSQSNTREWGDEGLGFLGVTAGIFPVPGIASVDESGSSVLFKL